MGVHCSTLQRAFHSDRRKPTPRPGLGKYLEPSKESCGERNAKPPRKRARLDRASLSFVNISFRNRLLEPISTMPVIVSTERLRPESPEHERPAPQLQEQEPMSSSSSVVEGPTELPDDVPQDWVQQPKHFDFDVVKDFKSGWYQGSKA